MIRNLRLPGLIAAITAFFAVSSSSASANPWFHFEGGPVTISGSQTTTNEFSTDPGTTACKKATFSGSVLSTSTYMTVTPTYSECTLSTIFGNIAVTINFNGCDYELEGTGRLHIVCPAGKNVVISGPGCTVTLPPQTSLGGALTGLSYKNTGSGSSRDIDATAYVSDLDYSYTGFTCGSGSNTGTGLYKGDFTLTASMGESQVGLWFS